MDLLLIIWFLGISVTVLWIPRLSDRRSRKLFTGFAIISDLVMYTFVLATESYGMMVLVLFVMGLTTPLRV